jgi:hypothetical protein
MPENLQQLIKKDRVFYQVLPYYALIEEGHGSPTAAWRIIQAGFNIDVHGVSNKNELELPPPDDYALGYEGLRNIVDASHEASECSIDVIPFPSTVLSEAREQFRSEAVIRIRISHHRGIDQPASISEQRGLEEVEKQLKGLGIPRR